jgi:hypothetical protein
MPWTSIIIGMDYLFFVAALFPFARLETSFARNFAMLSINFTGTATDSGNRIVSLLLTSYGASSSLKALRVDAPLPSAVPRIATRRHHGLPQREDTPIDLQGSLVIEFYAR